MDRRIPLTIVFVLGIVMIVQFFIPSRPSETFFTDIYIRWGLVMASFALIPSIGSLIRHHWKKAAAQKQGWFYSVVALCGLFGMTLVGFLDREHVLSRVHASGLFSTLFLNVQVPMQASMFGILAFYMASASYRAFRARTLEATLLLVAAFIVMFGVIPFGAFVWKQIPFISEWLLEVPNMAAKRGIRFGVGLGIAATSLKIILGIERSWMGGGGK
jgi:hypothetical protein